MLLILIQLDLDTISGSYLYSNSMLEAVLLKEANGIILLHTIQAVQLRYDSKTNASWLIMMPQSHVGILLTWKATLESFRQHIFVSRDTFLGQCILYVRVDSYLRH